MSSWFRRFMQGGLEHEHEPIPVDEHEDGRVVVYAQTENDNVPSWIRWWFQPGNGNGNYQGDFRPPVQHDDGAVMDDEQRQIEAAIRQSLQDEALREDMERSDHALRKAMEISRKEAEEAEARQKAEEAELAIVPAPPPYVPLVLPDLMSNDPLPVDLLGPDPSSSGRELMLLTDEAVARNLHKQINLLDDDSVGAAPQDFLGTLTGGQHSGGLALPPGAVGLPSGWNVPLPSSAPSPYLALTAPPTQGSGGKQCGGCKQSIVFGKFLNCLGQTWHPDCFRCKACQQPIVEKEFRAMGSDPYHGPCHQRLFHPKCSVCSQFVPVNAGGVIEYLSSVFWGDHYCREHDGDNTPRCTSCQRLERRDTPYVELEDGRKLCLNCVESVVVDTNDCTPLFHSILLFFEGLGMPVRQQIPLLCVEKQALNAARAGEQKGHHSEVIRGLCITEEQTIQTVVRLPGFPGRSLRGISQQPTHVQRHCEVTAILVLYGLPQLLTGSILAHEVMHAYLKLDAAFPQLPPHLEEGLCQVMSYLWLQAQQQNLQLHSQASSSASPLDSLPGSSNGATAGGVSSTSDQRPYPERFVEFCLHQIATDPSPVYGEGFRLAHAAVLHFGLRQTLDHVQLTSNLPS
eukprot:TRINITY_DN3875_c0_g1_i1.p1 TRINITY_DN3875_c0_g1~~TRINITY_DN3875_c0_g1_i1.p1  ORF type:complete len:628 (+),score=134.62 TRINITY_DN3875_c0_g1_i1:571-2454(+)